MSSNNQFNANEGKYDNLLLTLKSTVNSKYNKFKKLFFVVINFDQRMVLQHAVLGRNLVLTVLIICKKTTVKT